MGIESPKTNEGFSFRDRKFIGAHNKRENRSTHIGPEDQISTNTHEPDTGPMELSTKLKEWLQKHGLEGFIWVVEAPPHPDVQEVAKKLNVDTITNATIRKMLGLSGSGERHIEIPPVGVRKGIQNTGCP